VNILLLGPQGSGKGTQAKRIAAAYDIPHIETGGRLRAESALETELGLRVKPIIDSGRLVPDDLMIELIREWLGRPEATRGFVLDGFPRTMAQAEALDAMLREIGREPDIVFEFQISDDLAKERLLQRAEEEGRTDDTPELIGRRLALYHEQTEPLVEHYRTTGKLVGVHADRTVDQVFGELQDALEQVGARA
jgi:adenylate kinase